MYKCNHCNITIPDNQTEGHIVKVSPKDNPKFYCVECGEPVTYIPDVPKAPKMNGTMSSAQATLISNSDNRITTNNYYGSGGLPDEQIETPFGVCKKSEASFCKNCRQWVPMIFFNTDRGLCDICIEEEGIKAFDEGKSFYEMGLYDEALEEFLKYEPVCPKNDLPKVKTLIGKCYYKQKDYKQALRYFVVASRSDLDGLYYLGQCYYLGYGIDIDKKKAIELFQTAANKGHQLSRKTYDSILLIPVRVDGLYGYTDNNGLFVIPCKWKEAEDFHEGLAKVEDENSRYGFIDKSGRIVSLCQWKDAKPFHEGLAVVEDENNKYGFIDKIGENVTPCQWKSVRSFSEGLAVVEDENDKFGYIDRNGNNVIPCQWKNARSFSEGLAMVVDENGNHGFIDKTGKTVISCPYQWKDIESFHEGLAKVQDENNQYGFIDKTGEIVIPCQWGKDWFFNQEFHEGLALIKNKNGNYGFIDSSGRIAIACQWKDAEPFHEGLALVKGENWKWGYIDKSGNTVIPCQWKHGASFSEGLAAVEDQNGKYGFINKSGEIVFLCREKMGWLSDYVFHNGYIRLEWYKILIFRNGTTIIET